MTICPTCRNSIPELAFACPVCMRAKYLRGIEQSELELLSKVVSGGLPMKLLRAGRSAIHIGYQDGFSKEPYCQATLRAPRSSYCAFPDRPRHLCTNCMATLKAYLQKAGLEYHAGQMK